MEKKEKWLTYEHFPKVVSHDRPKSDLNWTVWMQVDPLNNLAA